MLRMWIAYAFGSAVFAGATAILSKIGIKNVNSNLATAIRTVVVLAFAWLAVYIAGSQNQIAGIGMHTMLFLILSGLSTGASWLCYFKALQRGNVNQVTPVDKSSTVLTMLFAFIFLGEKLTVLKGVCVILIGAGIYMMIEKKEVQAPQNVEKGWLLWAVLSAVFASLTSILGKVGIAGVESNLGTAIRTVVVLIMAWLVVLVSKSYRSIGQIDKKSWLFILLSGVATGCSWLCYYRALQEGPASVVVPIDKLSVLITIVFSYIVFKETLTKKALAGFILILAGTFLLLAA